MNIQCSAKNGSRKEDTEKCASKLFKITVFGQNHILEILFGHFNSLLITSNLKWKRWMKWTNRQTDQGPNKLQGQSHAHPLTHLDWLVSGSKRQWLDYLINHTVKTMKQCTGTPCSAHTYTATSIRFEPFLGRGLKAGNATRADNHKLSD